MTHYVHTCGTRRKCLWDLVSHCSCCTSNDVFFVFHLSSFTYVVDAMQTSGIDIAFQTPGITAAHSVGMDASPSNPSHPMDTRDTDMTSGGRAKAAPLRIRQAIYCVFSLTLITMPAVTFIRLSSISAVRPESCYCRSRCTHTLKRWGTLRCASCSALSDNAAIQSHNLPPPIAPKRPSPRRMLLSKQSTGSRLPRS